MALIRPNNRALQDITTLPTGITEYNLGSGDLPSGSVLQVVRTSLSTQGSTSNVSSYVAFGDAYITPKYASSSILILGVFHVGGVGSWKITRDGSTDLYTPSNTYLKWDQYSNSNQNNWDFNSTREVISVNLIDSPNTTNQVMYSLKMIAYDGSTNPAIGLNELTSGEPFSGITLMEIAG
jgi:hypothetical protein